MACEQRVRYSLISELAANSEMNIAQNRPLFETRRLEQGAVLSKCSNFCFELIFSRRFY